MAIAKSVKSYLESLDVGYELLAHRRTYSSRETAATAHVPDDHLAKAVILKDEHGFVMVVIPASNWIKLHSLENELDRELELATEKEIDALFEDCQPGAVPPLGGAYGIETVLDEALTTLAKVCFKAGDHEHLIMVVGEDFRRLLAGARRGSFSHTSSAT